MSLPELSIRRPVLVACVFALILGLGGLARSRLGVSLYPDVTYPVVNVVVPYPGAGPEEVESQVSKPIEGALGGLAGVRTLRSTSLEGAGVVTAVFGLETDMRLDEQQVTQTVARIRGELPREIQAPQIRSVDPTETPVLTLSLSADLPEGRLFDLADQEIRPAIEQAPDVGLVEIQGGRRREIQVALDEGKLKAHEVSATEVVERLRAAGINAPAGKVERPTTDTLVRSVGQFETLDQIAGSAIRFAGNEAEVALRDLGEVHDGLEDETSRVYVNGKRALIFRVFRRSGGNTVAVADAVRDRVRQLGTELAPRVPGFSLTVAHDGSAPIRDGVRDASEAIEIGVLLTVAVVLLFLGSWRSTLITGLALPNSLLGAFVLMELFGFTINITTLAALSLAVGLLIDDAIVVRENIFRRMQLGEPPAEAAVLGTREVTLAVVATTLTVISVFGPVAFLRGIIGQFFRQFGLTTCFAMLISLLDSLTVAPMLSARFGGPSHRSSGGGKGHRLAARAFGAVERFYLRVLESSLRRPVTVLALATLVFALSFPVLWRIPKSFLPPGSAGEFLVSLETAPGTSLDSTDRIASQVSDKIRSHAEVERTVLTVGGEHGETYQAEILVKLRPSGKRDLSTREVKGLVRRELAGFPSATTRIQDVLDIGGGAGQPFVLHLSGDDLDQLRSASEKLVSLLRQDPDLTDVGSSYRPGSPELQVRVEHSRAAALGVSSGQVAQELRTLIAGATPARYHEGGRDYGIRVRLRDEQRDLAVTYPTLLVPNLNYRLIPLPDVSQLTSAPGPSAIYRENRRRYVEISAGVNPGGRGLANALEHTRELLDSGQVRLAPGMRYEFAGQTRDFQELLGSVFLALALSVGFMYLVLASLYDSFTVPFSIMLVLPLAVCGAFYALGLTGEGLDIHSMVGCILLLGVAAKNSILLVDYIHRGVREGRSLREAVLSAGQVRLRPILMTSFALIAGMLPVAVPIAEAARSRSGMAVAVIGGIVTSTLLTLVVVPAAYGVLLRSFRARS